MIRLWDDPGPDKGWSFVILFSTWITSFFVHAPMRNGALLYHRMLLTMNITPAQAAWPFSVISAVGAVTGLSSGYLRIYYSSRQITIGVTLINTLGFILCFILPLDIFNITVSFGICYGIFYGVLTGVLHLPVIDYFKEYRASALGTAMTGISLSVILVPVIAKPILDSYDLRGVFLLLGGLLAHMLVSSALIRPRTKRQFPSLCETPKVVLKKSISKEYVDNESSEIKSEIQAQVTRKPIKKRLFAASILPFQLRSLLSNPIFGLCVASSCLVESSFNSAITIIVATCVSKGFSEASASLSLILMGAGDFSSKLTLTWLVDRKFISPDNMFAVSTLGQAACIFFFGFAHDVVVSMCSVFFFGFFWGCFFPVRGIVIANRFGTESYSFASSILCLFRGLLMLLNPALTGVLTVEGHQPFAKLCYAYSILCVLASLIWSLSKFF